VDRLSDVSSPGRAVPCVGLGYRLGKGLMDVLLGWFFLLLSLPVIAIAALAVRADSKGNPFFLQYRVGKDGELFKIIKLRGMYIDARERYPELYDYSAAGAGESLDFHFHYDEDPRVTRVGRFIRKTSIDELPNFMNVVLGHMSMVGPRPEVPDVFDMYGEYADLYQSVKPGITCMSKCTGRDSLTKRETLEIDMGYLSRKSLLGDCKIIWNTMLGVLLRRDVH